MLHVTAIPAAPGRAGADREGVDALRAVSLVAGPLPADADVRDATAGDADGRETDVRGDWVRAPGARGGAVIYVHGGGFAHSRPEAERVLAYRLSRATGRPTLRVDYRLAPAHPYPAALDDVLAAWRAVLNAGVPAADIALVGESAGATLVLSALLEIARTGGPVPGAAVAISPITDFTLTGASLDAADGRDVLSRAVLTAVAADYLAGASPREAPQSPLYGTLHGLPPLLVAVGTDEVLYDDARRFAEAADAAGVCVRLDAYEDMQHAFHLSEPGEVVLDRIGRWLADPVRAYTVSGPDAGPYGVASGPDGALWFTLVHQGAIGRRDAAGRVTTYPVGAGPTVITPGPDGALWFTEYGAHRVGRITVGGDAGGVEVAGAAGDAEAVGDAGTAGDAGSVRWYAPLTADAGPYGIAAGPDGAMWCTLSAVDRVARIAPDGTVTEYPAPGAFPSALVAGPDGALWCTLNQGNAVGRITTDGQGTAYPLPTEAAGPVGITAGPDGALWFVEIGAGQITVDGTITEYPLPDRAARPHAITTGPDGALWFTEWGSGRVGRITTDGDITAYDLPSRTCEPHGITAHDGAVWCALETGALARVAPGRADTP